MNTQMLTSSHGAELLSFKINGKEKIHQGENSVSEEGKVYWKRQWEILFPNVGKCKKNQTIINGKAYEMTVDGFIKDMEFEPVSKLDNFHSYKFETNKKLIDKYPYEFSLLVTYRIYQNTLTTIYKIVNEGDIDMPFGIGSKPTFEINLEDLEKGNYYLEFEEEEDKIHFLYLVDGLVGTEYAKNIMDSKKTIPLSVDTFRNDAIVMKGLKSKKISLKKKDLNEPILTMNYEGFPYLAIWSKLRSPFIAIEPWMSMPDNVNSSGVFRQKSDIILLPPKESYECRYTVEFN